MRRIRHRILVTLLAIFFLGVTVLVPADAQESLAPTTATAFVTGLYQQVLGRTPDPSGLAGWVGEIQQDGSVVPTVLAFFHSAEFLSRNTSNQQFLTICYQALLGRAPDPAGFNALLADLQSGTFTRDNLVDIFIDSAEFAALASFLPPLDAKAAFVTALYVRILGRGPDQLGLQGFVAQLQQSCSASTAVSIIRAFLASPEFQGRNTTNTAFVTLLYRVFLDRVPDAPGLAGWVTLLNQGTATRDQLVTQFAASPEFQAILQQLCAATFPDVRGTYTVFGTVTENNCPDPSFNGTFVFTGDTLTITTQVGGNFSGTGRLSEFITGVTVRVDLVFSGTVTPGGQLSGNITTALFFNNVFSNSAVGTFTGSVVGHTISLSVAGQALGGGCTFTASLSGTR